MGDPRLHSATTLIALAALAGCSFDTSIRYPFRTNLATPPLASVAVEAENHRPPQRGGQGTRIGRVRGGFGNPFPVDELAASNITRAAADAVADGLARAEMSVDAESPHRLVVAVNDYWMDGYGGFNASVKLDLTLRDPQGASVWHQSVGSTAGAFMSASVYEADAIAQEAFEKALQLIAVQCSELFRTDEFRRLVGAPFEAPVGGREWLRTLAGYFGARLGHPRELMDREGERPGRL